MGIFYPEYESMNRTSIMVWSQIVADTPDEQKKMEDPPGWGFLGNSSTSSHGRYKIYNSLIITGRYQTTFSKRI